MQKLYYWKLPFCCAFYHEVGYLWRRCKIKRMGGIVGRRHGLKKNSSLSSKENNGNGVHERGEENSKSLTLPIHISPKDAEASLQYSGLIPVHNKVQLFKVWNLAPF